MIVLMKYNQQVSLMNIYQVLLLMLFLFTVSGQFCKSKCSSCSSSSPDNHCSICFSTIFLNCVTLQTGLTRIQELTVANISTYWTINTRNTAIQCTFVTIWLTTYIYNFYNTMVGDDYLYRDVPITIPHYRLIIRFSIAYVGVWSTNHDYIWMHMDDTLQTYDVNLTYSCALTTGGTDSLCRNVMPGSTTNAYNGVDCIQKYTQDIYHNTTSLLINFTYPNSQRDATIKFWNLYDIIIVAYTCDVSCATCYGAANTQCFTCADNYYYVENNTCLNACPGGTYLLADPTNPLTGQCLNPCPQGYYVSGGSCVACPSGCLSCTSASVCSISTTTESQSLLKKYMVIWVLLVILFILLTIGIVYKICFSPKTFISQETNVISPENNRKASYQQRRTINETIEPLEPFNFHIEQIDYKDNVQVDGNPRIRKRVQKDQLRVTTSELN